MSNEAAVEYSIGFLEGWIEEAGLTKLRHAEQLSVVNAEVALEHLKIVSNAYTELRKKKYTIHQAALNATQAITFIIESVK